MAGASALAEGPEGEVWIGTPRGLSRHHQGRLSTWIATGAPGRRPASEGAPSGGPRVGGGPRRNPLEPSLASFALTPPALALWLGGVCTTWTRGEYEVDGCIHWLTGGPFTRLYEELGIFPEVETRILEHFVEIRDVASGLDVSLTRDLEALVEDLTKDAPDDAHELWRLVTAARHIRDLDPGLDRPAELSTLRDSLGQLWELRRDASELLHFRGSIGEWAEAHLKSERVRRFFTSFLPPEAPALFLAMQLGYLERGYLSRPVGGTAAFRDALVATYRRLGGETRLHATVDEVLVSNDRACGVRLDDGTRIDGDVVISTSSAPETVLRFLGGRYGAKDTERRLAHWKLFEPIVLVSFGVALPLTELPAMLQLQGLPPVRIGGRTIDRVYLRICNDDPCYAPAGHTVVQAMIETDYDYWASLGSEYAAEKDRVAAALRELLEPFVPGLGAAVRMTDVATPLTFWRAARSWRGAYEGWIPSKEALFGHIDKTLPGLAGFYMAGQWVEPGGGVPSAVLSGRQVIQLVCHAEGRTSWRAAPAPTRQAFTTPDPSPALGRPKILDARTPV